jgi:biotin carboxyl carrier protein
MKTFSKRSKDKLWVSWQGRIYALGLESATARYSSGKAKEPELVAPYSCKVLRILVKAGQTIAVGDPVIVVEAMKMEYSFASPRAGTIKRVLVEAGKIVPAAAAFVEWE